MNNKRGNRHRCLPSRTIVKRFEAKILRGSPDECWLWAGSHNSTGRPTFFVGGEIDQELAYRVAWAFAGNEIPKWPMVIDHLCKNIKCVNPAHLRVVSQAVNTTQNSNSQSAKNAAKTHCHKGHPLSGENLAIGPYAGGRCTARHCLTCYPVMWRYAVIEPKRPPGARKHWRGPHVPPSAA